MATPRMSRLSVRGSYMLLALVESLGMVGCLIIGMSLSTVHHHDAIIGTIFCLECLTFVLIVSLAMAAMGLYHTRLRGETSELLARIFLSFLLASVAQAVLFYFVPYLNIDALAIGSALGLSFIIVCLIRYGFSQIRNTSLLKRRILVLGSGEKANYIEKKMRRQSDRQGFRVIGYMAMDGDSDTVCVTKRLNIAAGELQQYVRDNQIEEIVIAPDQRRGTLPMNDLYRCRINGTKVSDIASFVEQESHKVPLNMLHPSWMVYGTGYQAGNYFNYMAKRGFDLIVSAILLAVIWPVMLITGLLIKLESGPRAPVLYSQQRVGYGGRPFWIYKFRSMREDAEKNGAVWAKSNDQRITAVGVFIRKYRIDELPQIFNILKGDMSFVGPRPERPEFVQGLSENIPYYGDRHQVKPGLTGWAQICYAYGASERDALEKLQYDLYYIKHFSILMDTMILIQTLEVVLFGKGAR